MVALSHHTEGDYTDRDKEAPWALCLALASPAYNDTTRVAS